VTAAGASSCRPPKGAKDMIIDVHAHYYPPRYLELLGRPGLPPAAAAALARQSTGERLALLDQVGIDTQVLSVSQAQPYLPDPGRAAEAAKAGNDPCPAQQRPWPAPATRTVPAGCSAPAQ